MMATATKTFPPTLKTTDGRIWTRTGDYREGPGITTHYARYVTENHRAAYYRGGRTLHAIRFVDVEDETGSTQWVCQPGRKIAEVEV